MLLIVDLYDNLIVISIIRECRAAFRFSQWRQT
jgi:hypothetical protein